MTQSVVQSTSGSLGGADGINLTLNGVAAGNALEIRIASYYGTPTPSATTVSGGGLTWVRAVGQDSSAAQGVRAEIWYAENVGAGNYTINIDCGAVPGNNYGRLWMGEIAGRATSGSHDSAANGTATATSNSPAVTGAGSSTQANAMVVGVLSADGGFTNLGIDAANGSSLTWTNRLVDQDPNNEMGASFDDAPATSTLTPSVNWGTMSTSASKWAAVIAVFKDAVTGSDLYMGAVENQDVFSGSLDVIPLSTVSLGAVENQDTFAGSLEVTSVSEISLGAIENQDIFSGSLNLDVGLALAATENQDVFSGAMTVAAGVAELTLGAVENQDIFSGTLEQVGLSTIDMAASEEPDVFSGRLVGPAVPDDGVLAPKFQGLRYPNVTRQWVGQKKPEEPQEDPQEEPVAAPEPTVIPLEPVGAAVGIVIPEPPAPVSAEPLPSILPLTAPPATQTPAALPAPEQQAAEPAGGATTQEPAPAEPVPPADFVTWDDMERVLRDMNHTIAMQQREIQALKTRAATSAASLERAFETVVLQQQSIDRLAKQVRNQQAAALATTLLRD